MVYGELGRFPLDINIKTRMVTFWHKLCTNTDDRYSSSVYKLLYSLHCQDINVGKWLLNVKQILDHSGLSHIWISQCKDVSSEWLKSTLKRRLSDQFVQTWSADVFSKSKCCNYRMFKSEFGLENYLLRLPAKWRKLFTKFRCRNSKLPIVSGIFVNTPKEERLCTLCNCGDIGDEFHYIFNCQTFVEQRRKFLKRYFIHHVSAYKMNILFKSSGKQLIELCKFIKEITQIVT